MRELPERVCNKPSHHYVAATEVVRASEVDSANLYAWLRRKGYKKCPYSRKIGNRLYVLDEVADEYLAAGGARRVAKRPHGWIPRAQAVELSGYSNHWWDRWIKAGKIRALRWRRIIFVHPDDVAAAAERRRRRTAPSDWVLLADLSRRAGYSMTVLKHRAAALGIRWRIYDHPRTLSDAAYIHETDVAAVLEAGIAPAPPPGWVPYTRIARRLGMDSRPIWEWLRRHGYEIMSALHPSGNKAGWCPPEAWEAYKQASYRLAGRGRAS